LLPDARRFVLVLVLVKEGGKNVKEKNCNLSYFTTIAPFVSFASFTGSIPNNFGTSHRILSTLSEHKGAKRRQRGGSLSVHPITIRIDDGNR